GLRLIQVGGERRFAVDVLSGSEGVQRDLLVLVGGRGDKDRLHALVVEDLAIIVHEFGVGRDGVGPLDKAGRAEGVAKRGARRAGPQFRQRGQYLAPLHAQADDGAVDGRTLHLVIVVQFGRGLCRRLLRGLRGRGLLCGTGLRLLIGKRFGGARRQSR